MTNQEEKTDNVEEQIQDAPPPSTTEQKSGKGYPKKKAKELVDFYYTLAQLEFGIKSKVHAKKGAKRLVMEIIHHYKFHNNEFASRDELKLADGNAIQLPTKFWEDVLDEIHLF